MVNSRKSVKGLSSKRNPYSLSNNFEKQNPGSEGLTAEFYFCFWEYVVTPLKDYSNDAYQRSEMLLSQRRDTLLLKNWRPITLFRKIATKCFCLTLSSMHLVWKQLIFVYPDRMISRAKYNQWDNTCYHFDLVHKISVLVKVRTTAMILDWRPLKITWLCWLSTCLM